MKTIYLISPERAKNPDWREKEHYGMSEREFNDSLKDAGCRMALANDCIPVGSHLYLTRYLNDDDPKERQLGLQCGLSMLESADEAWVLGTRVSEGMKGEIAHAHACGIPVRICLDPLSESPCLIDMAETGNGPYEGNLFSVVGESVTWIRRNQHGDFLTAEVSGDRILSAYDAALSLELQSTASAFFVLLGAGLQWTVYSAPDPTREKLWDEGHETDGEAAMYGLVSEVRYGQV